jgi:hypothetical protein
MPCQTRRFKRGKYFFTATTDEAPTHLANLVGAEQRRVGRGEEFGDELALALGAVEREADCALDDVVVVVGAVELGDGGLEFVDVLRGEVLLDGPRHAALKLREHHGGTDDDALQVGVVAAPRRRGALRLAPQEPLFAVAPAAAAPAAPGAPAAALPRRRGEHGLVGVAGHEDVVVVLLLEVVAGISRVHHVVVGAPVVHALAVLRLDLAGPRTAPLPQDVALRALR